MVDGAVWSDEKLFAPSPLTLSLRLQEGEHVLLEEGAAVLPEAIAAPRFYTVTLQPGEEILIASGTDDSMAALDRAPEELRRIGARARDRVLAEHTAEQRARALLTALQSAHDATARAA